MRRVLALVLVWLGICVGCGAQWRAATAEELAGFLPARAPVDKERIESEMRTASGIVNERGEMIGAVVLITAGYAAEGKFSHYLLTQRGLKLGDSINLGPGAYVLGWTRTDKGLLVHVSEAGTLKERGVSLAVPIGQVKRVESFRIWPPTDRRYVQIGRYMLPYAIGE